MELRRAASELVKVICRTEESRPPGRGKKPGKPKKKGLLASFEEWFVFFGSLLLGSSPGRQSAR